VKNTIDHSASLHAATATDMYSSKNMVIIAPPVGKGAISVAFVRPSARLSVAYISNNSRTQRPSVPKFGKKVPHL